MSFSNDIKNELLRLELSDDSERVSLLAGLVRMDGTILIAAHREISLQLVSENAAVARLAFSWLKELFHVEATVTIQRRNRLKKNVLYVVNVPSQTRMQALLSTLGMVDREGLPFQPEIAAELTSSDTLRRAYLRGVFLGSGSMTDPQRSYHLEIVTQSEEYAQNLIALIENYNIYPRMSYRKESIIVYLKESEQIEDFLTLTGATRATLKLMDIKIVKEMRNKVNRATNCEPANISKVVDAAMGQLEDIRLIQRQFLVKHDLIACHSGNLWYILNLVRRSLHDESVLVKIGVLPDGVNIKAAQNSLFVYQDMHCMRIIQRHFHRVDKRHLAGIPDAVFQKNIQRIPRILII